MIVMKFGGSGVADESRIKSVAEIVRARLSQKPVLVLSAMGDVTDHLLEAASRALEKGPPSVPQSVEFITGLHRNVIAAMDLNGISDGTSDGATKANDEIESLLRELASLLLGIALTNELTPKTRDFLVSFGERLSVRIASLYFNAHGIKALPLDAWDAGIVSTPEFGEADIAEESWRLVPQKLNPLLAEGFVPVVTGFIAKNAAGCITTLGRGGSDLSATFIASALRAEEAQVWKDVDGVLTADPRIVPSARPVKTVTYKEAAEMAYFGSQVLHPRAMLPCLRYSSPVIVKNSYNPDAEGTRISGSRVESATPVRTITTKKNVTLLDIVSTRMLGAHGFLAKVFQVFAEHKISIDIIATSEVSISLTLDTNVDNLGALKLDLQAIADVEIEKDKAIVTLVGDVRRSTEILARSLATCVSLGVDIDVISQGASKVNISFIVQNDKAPPLVQALHKTFFEQT
jgi:aspartate kinase